MADKVYLREQLSHALVDCISLRQVFFLLQGLRRPHSLHARLVLFGFYDIVEVLLEERSDQQRQGSEDDIVAGDIIIIVKRVP